MVKLKNCPCCQSDKVCIQVENDERAKAVCLDCGCNSGWVYSEKTLYSGDYGYSGVKLPDGLTTAIYKVARKWNQRPEPCEIEDTVYFINGDEIVEAKVIEFAANVYIYHRYIPPHGTFTFESFGKSVFLDRKSAEERLEKPLEEKKLEVNQKVYVIDPITKNDIIEGVVSVIRYTEKGNSSLEIDVGNGERILGVFVDDINKKVFFTREAAEKKIKENEQ